MSFFTKFNQRGLGPKAIALLLAAGLPCMAADAPAYVPLRAVVHVHTEISSGAFSVEEVAAKSAQDGVDVVIYTDHATTSTEFGIPPFRNIWKLSWSMDSILKYGPAAYLAQIREAQVEFPELILIPGVEVTPFYFWSIDVFGRHVQLSRTREHMLLIGMEDPEQYEQLPIIDNPHLEVYNTWYMWGAYFVGLYAVYRLARMANWKRGYVAAAVILGGSFGADFLKSHRLGFNQYEGDKGALPYEQLIEYGRRHRALVFWAHPVRPGKVRIPDRLNGWLRNKPEDAAKPSFKSSFELSLGGMRMAGIDVNSAPYTERLAMREYTGFALEFSNTDFEEGDESILARGELTRPGAKWDEILREYCGGRRDKPHWVIGERDFHAGRLMDYYTTVVWAKERTAEGVLEAMRNGRMHVEKYPLRLDVFEMESLADGDIFIAGDTAPSDEPYNIRIGVTAVDGDSGRGEVHIGLVRSGELVEVFSGPPPLEVNFADAARPDSRCQYYRIIVVDEREAQGVIMSNPIFLQ